MKRKISFIVIFGLFIGLLLISHFPLSRAEATATMDDPIETNLKLNSVVGDWFGMNISNYDVNENGTYDHEWSYVAVTTREITKTALTTKIIFDAYDNTTDSPLFPKQNGFVNLDQWELSGQQEFTMGLTRGQLINPFILPDDLLMSDIYIEIENMSQYLDYFPFDEAPTIEELLENVQANETEYENDEFSITSNGYSFEFLHLAKRNCSVTYHNDRRFSISLYHSLNITLNPQHNLLKKFSTHIEVIVIGFDDNTYSTIFTENYGGGGGAYEMIYDSNPNRGVWFYENWLWFIPTILILGIGLGVIVWWQLSLKQCEQDIANAFCRDPAEWRKRKYKGNVPSSSAPIAKVEPQPETSLLTKLS